MGETPSRRGLCAERGEADPVTHPCSLTHLLPAFLPSSLPAPPPRRARAQVKRFAFSGGQDTLEKHRELGANLDIDVPYQYLRFFLEDDAELERVRAVAVAGGGLAAACAVLREP